MLGLAGGGIVLSQAFREAALSNFDSRLAGDMDGLIAAAEPDQNGRVTLQDRFVNRQFDRVYSGLYFQIKPLATLAIDARVLHRKIYRYDAGAPLAPVDLAVGWGPMSDEAVLARLDVSQASRFYYYEWQGQPPIPREEIVSHSSNLHLIPQNDEIASECKSLRAGELVHISGLLVEATGPDIGMLRSSLSRTDSGKGACEIVWVEEIHKLTR